MIHSVKFGDAVIYLPEAESTPQRIRTGPLGAMDELRKELDTAKNENRTLSLPAFLQGRDTSYSHKPPRV